MCLNGAAARMVQPGDKVIIIAYGIMTEAEVEEYIPKIVMVDGENRVLEVRPKEIHGELFKITVGELGESQVLFYLYKVK